jgi:hypothetical protein
MGMTNTNQPVTTREQYLKLFADTSEAIEFENSVLSAGRDFLPAQALVKSEDR